MKLILCNDDFAFTYGLTEAVKECFLEGITTCTSIRVDGAAFEYACQEVLPKVPELELGLHLNLTEGRPVSDPGGLPDLVDQNGLFRQSFMDLFRMVRAEPAVVGQIDRELRAQFLRAADWNLDLQFVNGNQHVHMIPRIFDRVCHWSAHFGIPCLRLPSEPWIFSPKWKDYVHMLRNLNFAKHFLLNRLTGRARHLMDAYGLRSVGPFFGVLYTGCMNAEVLRCALERLDCAGVGVVEVLFHPADIDHPRDNPRNAGVPLYYFHRDRVREKNSLLSGGFKKMLQDRQVVLTTHRRVHQPVAKVRHRRERDSPNQSSF